MSATALLGTTVGVLLVGLVATCVRGARSPAAAPSRRRAAERETGAEQ